MTDETPAEETPAKSGDAAWKEHREAVSRRNAQAHKRGRAERQSRAAMTASSERAQLEDEAEQLRKLNDQIAKQQPR
jgi:hypothetical protein